ncbi:MAG: 2-oxoacid:ferredoxin oxidoreductase subunit beta [Planctomycetes bacterium]|nr:2-oxoacid:ferredoxin oxidoreductase subunit beta [Planctomycetota bacterium]
MTDKATSTSTNALGLGRGAYAGGKSTLCPGCGHDSVTAQIIAACYELNIPPHRVAKFSGIGCSSKTPGYFLSRAQGFNGTHGRMPSIATGGLLANRSLIGLGVTGDGDTASIGLGQFAHLLRRNVRMAYIIENNGVYGLTKGQFSATADEGSVHRGGEVNRQTPIDCCALALELGCGFVSRTFSADRTQLAALLKAALSFDGTALIDVVSPCVTFNNHPSSTKSYGYVKEHEEPLHAIDFIPHFEPHPEIELKPGEVRELTLHDGSVIRLLRTAADYDPQSRRAAFELFERARGEKLLPTGLLFFDPSRPAFDTQCGLVDEPLAALGVETLRPPPEALAAIMEELK